MGTAVAATPNFLIQEMCSPYVANLDKYTEHDWRIGNGYINVIDGPGLGLEAKEVDIATVPHEPMAYRHYRYADGKLEGLVTRRLDDKDRRAQDQTEALGSNLLTTED